MMLLKAMLLSCVIIIVVFSSIDGQTDATSLVLPSPVPARSIHSYGDTQRLNIAWETVQIKFKKDAVTYNITINYNDEIQTQVGDQSHQGIFSYDLNAS